MQFPKETEAFSRAALLLHSIREDSDRLDLVLELQRMLIRNIVRCERRIRRLKRARGRLQSLKAKRLSKDRSKAVKALIERIDARVEKLRHLMFLWRCFGDGIASVYQSQHSLKHLLYDENYIVKQHAGFISEKAGFLQEFRILRRVIRMGVPIVMADLTNIIRHGDLCALAGADPFPLEVKSSRNRNARTERQVEQIRKIREFFANDGATSFRGNHNVVRVEQKLPVVTYVQEVNDCLSQAFRNGISVCTPEHGLSYIAISNEGFEEKRHLLDAEMDKYVGRSILSVLLTPDLNWLPAYPFTLSMVPANAVLFMQRRVHLMAIIDLKVVKSHFLERGVHAVAIMDGVYSFQICLDPKDLMKGVFRISEQLFLRVAAEFQSLRWFAAENSTAFDPIEALELVAPDTPGPISETLAGWQEVRDCYEEIEPRDVSHLPPC